MNNEMTLDKAVKLSDEELGTVAGGVNYTESELYIIKARARYFVSTYKGGKPYIIHINNMFGLEVDCLEGCEISLYDM